MSHDIVHDAATTDRFTLKDARSLHRHTCREPACVVLELHPDSPWEIASRHLRSPSAYLRRLAVQHPGCPLDTRLAMLEDDSPDVVRAAVSRQATPEFDRTLLQMRRFVGRRELARFPDRTLAALEDADAIGWERMAKWCDPALSALCGERFMGHEAWKVRAAYVRAHHEDEATAVRAAGDPHPRVRAALAAVTPDRAGLAEDRNHLVRKAVASNTSDPGVSSLLRRSGVPCAKRTPVREPPCAADLRLAQAETLTIRPGGGRSPGRSSATSASVNSQWCSCCGVQRRGLGGVASPTPVGAWFKPRTRPLRGPGRSSSESHGRSHR